MLHDLGRMSPGQKFQAPLCISAVTDVRNRISLLVTHPVGRLWEPCIATNRAAV